MYINVIEALGVSNDDKTIAESVKKSVRRHCGQVRKKWEESHRIGKEFIRNNRAWLDAQLVITIPNTRKRITKTTGSSKLPL